MKNFARSYYTWDNSKESTEKHTASISKYMTKALQDLNVDTVRSDIPTSSTVSDVLIWRCRAVSTDEFTVTYEVDQQVKEGDQTKAVSATYTVTVHVDADGKLVIVQNTTLAPAQEKSGYEPKALEADGNVDADTMTDATAFLETFFKLYPTAYGKGVCLLCTGKCPYTDKRRLPVFGADKPDFHAGRGKCQSERVCEVY